MSGDTADLEWAVRRPNGTVIVMVGEREARELAEDCDYVLMRREIQPWKAVSECTGIAAVWCPIHGDCICEARENALDDPDCPLHNARSRHAEAGTDTGSSGAGGVL